MNETTTMPNWRNGSSNALTLTPPISRWDGSWIFAPRRLRNIIIGIGGKMDGYMMASKFGIAVSSELMAILSIVRDLKDLRESDWARSLSPMIRKANPSPPQTLKWQAPCAPGCEIPSIPPSCPSTEYQPVLVHAGPFANIAVGQSSIIGDRIGLKMFDYHVTESGFAADIGFEKFWNVKMPIERSYAQCFHIDDNDQGPEDARRRPNRRCRTAPS